MVHAEWSTHDGRATTTRQDRAGQGTGERADCSEQGKGSAGREDKGRRDDDEGRQSRSIPPIKKLDRSVDGAREHHKGWVEKREDRREERRAGKC